MYYIFIIYMLYNYIYCKKRPHEYRASPEYRATLIVVNVRTDKNAIQLSENVVQNDIAIGYKSIKTGISSSVATLEVVMKRL